MADRDRDNRSADEIRRDIEGKRADMHETVEALERKLSPGQLLDEVWGRVRSGSSGSGVGGGMGDVIRDHPVPLALMGLGMAWLAVEKATESEGDRLRGRYGATGPGTYAPAEGRVGPYRGDAVHGDEASALDKAKDKAGDLADKARGMAGKAKDKASDAADAARSKTSDVRDRLGSDDQGYAGRPGSYGTGAYATGGHDPDDGPGLRDRAGEGVDRAREEAQYRARQAKRGFWSALEQQPLAMGAVAFGLGLAGGLAAPTTRWEDEHMGGAADAVKREAKDAARDAGESAKRVAKDTVHAAKEEADRQDVVGDLKGSVQAMAADAKQSAKRVAEEAKRTAKQRGKEEDLDPEGMKERAEKHADRAGDKAGDRLG